MQILLLITTLIVGGLFNLIKKTGFKFVYKLAAAYIFMVSIMGICSCVFYFTAIKNPLVIRALPVVLNWMGPIAHLLLGYLMISLLVSSTSAKADEHEVKKLINLMLWGLTILTGLSFITESYWNIENLCKILGFFTASGYTLWFLYLITVAEALGGLGVLLHFKLKTGPVAAAGLMLIMIGALYTHNHNNDSLSASYAAIEQFIMLSLLQVIYYLEKQTDPVELNYIPTT